MFRVQYFSKGFKNSGGRMAAIFELIIAGVMPMQAESRRSRKS